MPFIKSSDETIKLQHNDFIAKEFGTIDKEEKSRSPYYIVLDHSDLKTSSHLNSAGIQNESIIVPNLNREVFNKMLYNRINQKVQAKPECYLGTLCQLLQDPTFLQGKTIGGIWYDSTSRYSTSETQETIKHIFTKLQFLENSVLAFTFTGQRGTKVEWEDVIHNLQDNLKATARETRNLNLKCIKREVYGNQMIFIAFRIIKNKPKNVKKRHYHDELVAPYRNKRTRNSTVEIASETENNSSSSNNESESGYELEDQSDTFSNEIDSDDSDGESNCIDNNCRESKQNIQRVTRNSVKSKFQQLFISDAESCKHCKSKHSNTSIMCVHCHQKETSTKDMIRCNHEEFVKCPKTGKMESTSCNMWMHETCLSDNSDEFTCALHWCFRCSQCAKRKDQKFLDASEPVYKCIFCPNSLCEFCEVDDDNFTEVTKSNASKLIPFADLSRFNDSTQRYFVCDWCTDWSPADLTPSERCRWKKYNPRKTYKEFIPENDQFIPAKWRKF